METKGGEGEAGEKKASRMKRGTKKNRNGEGKDKQQSTATGKGGRGDGRRTPEKGELRRRPARGPGRGGVASRKWRLGREGV